MKETFNLKHELHGKMFPCNFIKIGKWTPFVCTCNLWLYFFSFLHNLKIHKMTAKI